MEYSGEVCGGSGWGTPLHRLTRGQTDTTNDVQTFPPRAGALYIPVAPAQCCIPRAGIWPARRPIGLGVDEQ